MAHLTELTELDLDISTRSIGYFTGMRDDEPNATAVTGLLLDPPYQRSSCWTKNAQRLLIKSFLMRLPVPAVVTNDRFGAGTFRAGDKEDWQLTVIDGKQRILACLAWVDGDLTVPADWFNPEYVATTQTDADGTRVVAVTDLTLAGRRLTQSRILIPVAQATLATVKDEARVYLTLNTGGTQHTDADLAVARELVSDDL